MLERNSASTNNNNNSNTNNKNLHAEIATLYNIEPVPRKYEESMLTSPRDGENPCCNGTGCQTYKWFGFIMKEFITPLELAEMKNSLSRNNIVKMCLVCVRKAIDFLQTSYIIGNIKNPQNYINQFHRNRVNEIGEYTFEYSIPLGNGIIYPVIMNNRLAYTHHNTGNFHWLTQDGYRQCTQEDIDQQNFLSGTFQQKNQGSVNQHHPSPSLLASTTF
jgi:hypothetical protein